MHTNTVRADATGPPVVGPDFVVLGTIAVKHGAIADLAMSADGSTLVATHYGDAGVSVIDAESMTADTTVTVAGDPFAVVTADCLAYVTTAAMSYDSVAVIDTETKQVIENHPLAYSATDVAVSPDGARAFASRIGRDRVDLAVIDTTEGQIGTIDIAQGAGITIDAVRVSPNGRLVYVATSDADSGRLLVVDAHAARVIRAVPIASPIRDVALSREGDLAYVASFDPYWGGSVDVIDTAANEITAKVGIGGAPMQMALSPDGTRAYIAAYDHVDVLCTATNSIVDTITVTEHPSCVAIGPDGSRLYVADHDGSITVLSVAADTSMLETEFIATNIDTVPEPRELEPAV